MLVMYFVIVEYYKMILRVKLKIFINFFKKGEYYLYAVVMHVGENSEFGHYYTIARENPEDDWYEFNDMKVTNLS